MKNIIVPQTEIDEILNKAMEAEDSGKSNFRGMMYEQGIIAMYDWLVGNKEENPFE